MLELSVKRHCGRILGGGLGVLGCSNSGKEMWIWSAEVNVVVGCLIRGDVLRGTYSHRAEKIWEHPYPGVPFCENGIGETKELGSAIRTVSMTEGRQASANQRKAPSRIC